MTAAAMISPLVGHSVDVNERVSWRKNRQTKGVSKRGRSLPHSRKRVSRWGTRDATFEQMALIGGLCAADLGTLLKMVNNLGLLRVGWGDSLSRFRPIGKSAGLRQG